MKTKTELTLDNACFRYDGSKEAKECIEMLNSLNAHRTLKGYEGFYYSLNYTGEGVSKGRKTLAELIVVSPSVYLALKERLLTQADLIEGNRFECIEDWIDKAFSINLFKKGNIFECNKIGELSAEFRQATPNNEWLNRHFKLLPTQEESVKGEEIINDGLLFFEQKKMIIQGGEYIDKDDFEVYVQSNSALQQQLKEAKELLKKAEPLIEELKISSPLNRPICNSVVSSINQFLNRNK